MDPIKDYNDARENARQYAVLSANAATSQYSHPAAQVYAQLAQMEADLARAAASLIGAPDAAR